MNKCRALRRLFGAKKEHTIRTVQKNDYNSDYLLNALITINIISGPYSKLNFKENVVTLACYYLFNCNVL